MTTIRRNVLSAACAAALGVYSIGTLAGAADVRTSEGGQMKFEYRGGDQLRITTDGQNGYMVTRNGEIFMVTQSEGQVMVMSLSQTLGMFGAQAGAASPSTVEGKLLSLEPTGGTETVAGIKGEVYRVRYLDQEGQERTTDLVLSDDRRAREFQRALFTMINGFAGAAGKTMEGPEELQARLTKMNKGTLRFGEQMWVTAISDREIDPSRFVLPAEPMDMSAMGGMFGGNPPAGGGESGGGFMSRIFGDKAQRQQDRVEDRTDQEVDRQTDEAVDSVMDRAFDKIFGR